jgi:hypothetical protein
VASAANCSVGSDQRRSSIESNTWMSVTGVLRVFSTVFEEKPSFPLNAGDVFLGRAGPHL